MCRGILLHKLFIEYSNSSWVVSVPNSFQLIKYFEYLTHHNFTSLIMKPYCCRRSCKETWTFILINQPPFELLNTTFSSSSWCSTRSQYGTSVGGLRFRNRIRRRSHEGGCMLVCRIQHYHSLVGLGVGCLTSATSQLFDKPSVVSQSADHPHPRPHVPPVVHISPSTTSSL